MINKLQDNTLGTLSNTKVTSKKVNEIIEVLNNTGGGPKTYKNSISQTGTTKPTIDNRGSTTSLLDTIGGVWAYSSTGVYTYTKANAFTDKSKVFAYVVYSANTYGPDAYIYLDWTNANTLTLTSAILTQFTSPSGITLSNGLIYQLPVVIEVYS